MSKMLRKELFEQFQQLDESLLTSEFTFGFELEAICGSGKIHDECYNDDDTEESIENIRNHIDDELTIGMNSSELKGESSIHQDSSVNADEDEDDYEDNQYDVPFEYASPIIPCTPIWFSKVIKTLKSLLKDGIYTNETCGFHHHLHFSGMNERDMVWIYCNMASDPTFIETFKRLETDNHNYGLYSGEWAKLSPLQDLGECIRAGNWEGVLEGLNTRKWKAFRIHPQGTLEWRGPRDFMNNKHFDNINKFYALFGKLITYIKKYMDSKTLIGASHITREELYKNLTKAVEKSDEKPDLEFISHNEGYDSSKPIKFDSLKKGINERSAINILNWFNKEPDIFVDKVLEENPNLIKLFKYCFRDSYKLMEPLKSAIMSVINSYGDEAKEFSIKLSELIVKNKIANLYQFIDTFKEIGITKFMPKDFFLDTIKRTSSYYSIENYLELCINAKIKLTLADIEDCMFELIERGTFNIYSCIKLFNSRFMVRHLGYKNITKIMLWLFKACHSTNTMTDLVNDDSMINRMRTAVEGSGLVKEWDRVMMNIAYDMPIAFAFIINRPHGKDLVRYIAKNRSIKQYLTYEEQAELDKLGIKY